MDFEETLQMVENACSKLYGNRIDHNEVVRSATKIYLANLPRKNLLKKLQKVKEDVEDLSYYTFDGQSVPQEDVLKILDKLIESIKE